jgi:ribose transport system permease protein
LVPARRESYSFFEREETVTRDPATSRRIDWRRLLERVGPLLTLAILIAATAICERVRTGGHNFLSAANLVNILRQWSAVGIVALGMTLVIISGGIDLSVGSLLAFTGGVGVWMMNTVISAPDILQGISDANTGGLPPPDGIVRAGLAHLAIKCHLDGNERCGVAIGIATILVLGTLGGWINGLLIAKGRIAPFIATLGGLAAYRSMALTLADGGDLNSASDNLFGIAGNHGIAIPGIYLRRGLPLTLPYMVIVFFVLAIIMSIVLNKTRYGRYVYAIGANERAAGYSAINVDRIKILTYTITGALTGMAAFLVASNMNSVPTSTAGNLYELDVIAAVVIGGTRMNGGAGSIFGTVIGVLILGVISNMLSYLNVSPLLQGLVKGGIIVAAVYVQQIGRKPT